MHPMLLARYLVAVLVAMLDPYRNREQLADYASRGLTTFEASTN